MPGQHHQTRQQRIGSLVVGGVSCRGRRRSLQPVSARGRDIVERVDGDAEVPRTGLGHQCGPVVDEVPFTMEARQHVGGHGPDSAVGASPERSRMAHRFPHWQVFRVKSLTGRLPRLPISPVRCAQRGMAFPSLRAALITVIPLTVVAFAVHLPWLAVAAAAGALPALISWVAQQ